MKKLMYVLIFTIGAIMRMQAEEKTVVVDITCDEKDVYSVALQPGQSVEIERLCADENALEVRYKSLASRIGTSFFRTVADSPFFSAITIWALLFCRDSIPNHPIKSMLIGGVLISDFALHMLHSADQKINITG